MTVEQSIIIDEMVARWLQPSQWRNRRRLFEQEFRADCERLAEAKCAEKNSGGDEA